MRTAAVALVAVCSLAGVMLPAQAPVSSGQTFRSGTRLIQVSVVVHDGRNRPVEGLTARDFQVFEDGKELPVSLFDVQSGAATAAADEAHGIFTNRVQSPSSGGVVAIVFDRLNTSVMDQASAHDHIVRYLGQVRPDDRIALYVLGPGGMQVLHDFTMDARSLLAALDRARTRSSELLAPSEESMPEHIGFGDSLDAQIDAFVNASLENMKAFYQRRQAYTTIQALHDVAEHLAGVPGRKNLVWISSGFPFSTTEVQGGPRGTRQTTTLSSETRGATRILSDGDIAVYPVDARGLVGAFATSASARSQQFSTLNSVEKPIDGLRTVADWTGGRAFYNTNDLGTAINRAVDDSRLTYILGYYPANEKWDSKFRSIEVKVRRPGTRVRHRTGYFATPPGPAAQLPAAQAIMTALDSPLESTTMPLTVGVRPEGDGKFVLTLQIDPAAVTLAANDGKWTGKLDIAIAQTMTTGEHLRETDLTLPLSFSGEEHGQFLERGLAISRTITLRSEVHQVRVVARDVATGRLGSVIIPASRLH